MVELDPPVGHPPNRMVVGDHYDGMAVAAKVAEDAHHFIFVLLVEISGWFIGQNYIGVVDERARNADPLLFAARELPWQVMEPATESDADQCIARFGFISH